MREYVGKNPREKRCLSMLSCVYLEDSIDVLLKYTKKDKQTTDTQILI